MAAEARRFLNRKSSGFEWRRLHYSHEGELPGRHRLADPARCRGVDPAYLWMPEDAWNLRRTWLFADDLQFRAWDVHSAGVRHPVDYGRVLRLVSPDPW